MVSPSFQGTLTPYLLPVSLAHQIRLPLTAGDIAIAPPAELDDDALLALFTAAGAALCRRAGGLRRTLELADTDLVGAGLSAGEIYRLRAALELGERFASSAIDRGEVLTSPTATRRALSARLRDRPHEVFACLFLTNRHAVIGDEEIFRGTIDGAPVYPREIAKRALELNAAAVVAAHNHPSGVAEPSRSDRAITSKLRDALALVEVRLLDHFVIGDGETVSFAERGWL